MFLPKHLGRVHVVHAHKIHANCLPFNTSTTVMCLSFFRSAGLTKLTHLAADASRVGEPGRHLPASLVELPPWVLSTPTRTPC